VNYESSKYCFPGYYEKLSNEAGMLQEQARQTKLVGESENPLGATANIRTAKADINGLENS